MRVVDPALRVHRADAVHSRAKVMLAELGFTTVWSFVRQSGVHHMTVSDLLYRPLTARRQRLYNISSVVKIFGALTAAYGEREAAMHPDVRKVVKRWIIDWAERAVRCDVALARMGGRGTKDPKNLRQRELRLKKRRAHYEAIIKGFK